MLHLLLLPVLALFPGNRAELALDGPWEITSDDPLAPQAAWRPIEVPSSFESALGVRFDGVASYRRSFTIPEDFAGQRLVLHFDAVATEAHVWLNDELVGTHLGGWTAFRVDVTAVARRGAENRLLVMVDEKVGHNTQGFLPIIAPHFGGIWQSVRLLGLSDPWINDLAVLAAGDAESATLALEAPLVGDAIGCRLEAEATIGEQRFGATLEHGRRVLHVEGFEPWDVGRPNLYPVSFRLLDDAGREIDSFQTSAAFRSARSEGRRLLLNGRPLSVRGMLEWGYYAPLLAPAPPEEQMRREIAECRARGFNLVKFCLWLPPRRILRLFDEAGMLAWMEYPTWHPTFDEAHRADLVREFEEFYAHDRNHPSVLLRSLTCETGPSASLEVIQDLYDRAHARVPGALVVDDSSWIAWNRVFDFYDDHPYGNNDTWPAELDALNRYVDERERKPLMLGEAISADTWPDLLPLSEAAALREWWVPIHYRSQVAWEAALAARSGAATAEALIPHSLRFGLNQRKDQIEAFRLIVPDGGYVVSVARDVTVASMGLSDHLNRWKWAPREWTWHGDTMLVLGRGTPRSCRSGETLELPVFVAHHGFEPIEAGAPPRAFARPGGAPPPPRAGGGPGPPGPAAGRDGALPHAELARGTVTQVGAIVLRAPEVEAPAAVTLRAGLDDWRIANEWTLWIVPAAAGEEDDGVIVADALSPELLERLAAGARVLHLAGGAPGSFVVRPIWFLRGSVWYPPHPLLEVAPPDFFTDLVVKDLHPPGLLPVHVLAGQIDPIVPFWETHDIKEVREWAMVFETNVGQGRLLVSALHHEGAAGQYLIELFRRHLAAGPAPESTLAPETVARIADRLVARTMDLTAREWQFRPEAQGGAESPWVPLRVGQSWEGQGFGALDGWATYRLEVDLPEDWGGEPLYLNFEGVDDAFEVFCDGEKKGAGGDIEQRLTAFDTSSAHLLGEAVAAGRHVIEVRVFDWYGAGGIHRPVSLSTRPLGPAADFIQR